MGMAGMATTAAASMGGYGTLMQVGGQLYGGYAQGRASAERAGQDAYQAVMVNANAEADAASIKDAAAQHARKLRQLTAREVSGARAATAASGVALDEFSLINTTAIDTAGEQDAAVAILNGDRQARQVRETGQQSARALEASARGSARASRDAFMSGIVGAAGRAYSGWKGAQAPTGGPTTGDFARMDRGQI